MSERHYKQDSELGPLRLAARNAKRKAVRCWHLVRGYSMLYLRRAGQGCAAVARRVLAPCGEVRELLNPNRGHKSDSELGTLRLLSRRARHATVRYWHISRDFAKKCWNKLLHYWCLWIRDPAIRAGYSIRHAFYAIRARLFDPRLGRLCHYDPRPVKVPASYCRQSPPSDAPRISIVTPSYNQGQFLERTLQSVLGQKYPRLQYIVQDGGSTDSTQDVLRQYRPYLAHCESARDRGQTHALNLGFRHATGDILAYLNSDDLLLPGALAYVAKYFTEHPEIDVIYSHRVIVDEHDREVGRWVLPSHQDAAFFWRDFVPQETLFWRRRVWEKIGGAFDESFRFAMDWDLLLRLRSAGARFARVDRFLGAFRNHSGQKTETIFASVGEEEVRRLELREHGRRLTEVEIAMALRPYFKRHVLLDRLHRLGLAAA